ncbi:MAG: T9SS type A sorting domain-containing protein [Cryomorphaceae bacterium]|nr:T9SS type A sorting domain-containing protein [Flavobacteriales bacterium]
MKKYLLFTVAFSMVSLLQAQSSELLSQFGYGSSLADRATDVKYHPDGDIVLYGTFRDDLDFDPSGDGETLDPLGNPDIFLAKYSTSGDLVWAFNLGRIALNDGMNANAMAVNDNGDIFITGGFSNTVNFNPLGDVETLESAGGLDAFLAKYNSDGQLLWVQRYGTLSSETGTSVALTNDGEIFMGLRYNADIDVDLGENENILVNQGGTDAALLALAADGEFNFAYDVSTSGNDVISEIAVSDLGRIAIGATVNGALSGLPEREMFISVHDFTGELLWDYNYGAAEVFNAIADIQFDNDQALFVAGRVQGTSDFNPDPEEETSVNPLFADPFIAKYNDLNGNLQWVRTVESSGTEDFGTGILQAGVGVFLVGAFDNTAIFVPGDFSTQVTSQGGRDLFFAQYNQLSGDFVAAETYGGDGDEFPSKADYKMDGNAVLAGDFTNNLALNPSATPISSAGFSDVFFAEFQYQTDLSTNLRTPKEKVKVYPVPASNELNFSLPKPKGSLTVRIISVVGVEVANYHFNSVKPSDNIDLSDLNTGIYIVEFTFDGQRISKRFVKQ